MLAPTGYVTLENTLAAMQAGAFDYLANPFRLDEVRELVAGALQMARLERENQALREQVQALRPSVAIVNQDPAHAGPHGDRPPYRRR